MTFAALLGARRSIVAGVGAVALVGGVMVTGGASAAPSAGALSVLSAGIGTGLARNVSQIPTGLLATPGGTVDVADAEGFLRTIDDGTGSESWLAGSVVGSDANGVRPVDAGFSFGPFGGPAALGLAVDKTGDIFVAEPESGVVRVLAATTGTRYGIAMTKGRVYTVAGLYDLGGTFTSGAVATATPLPQPGAVAVDPAGDLVIANQGNNQVAVVAATSGRHYGQTMTVGHIYAIAGTGTAGTATSGTPGTSTELSSPDGLAFTPRGLAISSTGGHQVVVLATSAGTEYGVAMPTAGDIYPVVDTGGTGGPTTSGGPGATAEVEGPTALATDPAGDLYVADPENSEVDALAVTTHTVLTTPATAGHLYVVAGTGTDGGKGNNGIATAAQLESPEAVAVDRDGNLLIGDAGLDNVILVAAKTEAVYGQTETSGRLYYVAGDGLIESSGYGAQALGAENNEPIYDTVAPGGDVAFADLGFVGEEDGPRGHISRSLPFDAPFGVRRAQGPASPGVQPELSPPDGPGKTAGRIRVIASRDETTFGINMVAGGLYTVAGGATADGDAPDGQLATQYGMVEPVGSTYDVHGNLVVSDFTLGLIEVVAATNGTFYGQVMKAGHLYTIGGTTQAPPPPPIARKVKAAPIATATAIEAPGPVAVDSHGNVIVGEIDSGQVQVIAAVTGTFYGQAMTAGDLYTIAGNGTEGDSGDGGPATAAEIGAAYGVAVDPAGDVVINSVSNDADDTVRFVPAKSGTHFGQAMTAHDIYTVAGGGSADGPGFGNGGPATSATVDGPGGIAFTASGGLVLGDTAASEIRMVPASAGTYYGIKMFAGDIYAVAGDGTLGRTATPRPATGTALDDPYGVALTDSGTLVFTEEVQGIIGSIAG